MLKETFQDTENNKTRYHEAVGGRKPHWWIDKYHNRQDAIDAREHLICLTERGFNFEMLAEEFGISRSTLSNVARGVAGLKLKVKYGGRSTTEYVVDSLGEKRKTEEENDKVLITERNNKGYRRYKKLPKIWEVFGFSKELSNANNFDEVEKILIRTQEDNVFKKIALFVLPFYCENEEDWSKLYNNYFNDFTLLNIEKKELECVWHILVSTAETANEIKNIINNNFISDNLRKLAEFKVAQIKYDVDNKSNEIL